MGTNSERARVLLQDIEAHTLASRGGGRRRVMANECFAVHGRNVQYVEQTRSGNHARKIELIGSRAIEIGKVRIAEGALGSVASKGATRFASSTIGVIRARAPA